VATAGQTAGNVVVQAIKERDEKEEEEEEDLLLNLEEDEVLWKLMLDEMDKLEMTKKDESQLPLRDMQQNTTVCMYIHGIHVCTHLRDVETIIIFAYTPA